MDNHQLKNRQQTTTINMKFVVAIAIFAILAVSSAYAGVIGGTVLTPVGVGLAPTVLAGPGLIGAPGLTVGGLGLGKGLIWG